MAPLVSPQKRINQLDKKKLKRNRYVLVKWRLSVPTYNQFKAVCIDSQMIKQNSVLRRERLESEENKMADRPQATHSDQHHAECHERQVEEWAAPPIGKNYHHTMFGIANKLVFLNFCLSLSVNFLGGLFATVFVCHT